MTATCKPKRPMARRRYFADIHAAHRFETSVHRSGGLALVEGREGIVDGPWRAAGAAVIYWDFDQLRSYLSSRKEGSRHGQG